MRGFNIEKVKKIISFIVFISIIAFAYVKLTYLMRNSSVDRANVIGIKEEAELDVVFVGGSSTMVYWQPLKAWHDYGFTSYNYSTNTNQAENIIWYIKEILKTKTPELFVVDLRAFQYWSPVLNEAGVRNGLDSMNLGLDRWKYARYILGNREIDEETDVLSYYFDIAKYHTQYEAFANPVNWEYIDNSTYRPDKGFGWEPPAARQEKPEGFMTDQKGGLDERCIQVLVDLLDYCKEENLQVLFVVCPYVITREDMMKYNTMAEVITGYGYPYLNTNEYYTEMGIDFETDFFNADHVDCLGAEKYTCFIGEYICDNYNMPDHSNDGGDFEKWDIEFERFEEEAQSRREQCYLAIDKIAEGYRDGNSLKYITDFYEYLALARNDRMTIIIVTQGLLDEATVSAGRNCFFGMVDAPLEEMGYIGIEVNNTNFHLCGEAAASYRGTLDRKDYEIRSGEEASVVIGGIEYCCAQPGINLVIYNNDYHNVVDSIALSVDADGNIEILR